MDELPSGIVTFLLTDVERSASRWESDPATAGEAIARHDATIARAIEQHHGVVLKRRGEGDSTFCVFARPGDAVACAAALHRFLELRVRIAIHTGEVELRDGDYFGVVPNRAARLREVAHGGQALVSEATRALVVDTQIVLTDLGTHRLRDLARPEHVWQLGDEHFPPLRSLDVLPNNLPVQLTSFVGRDHEIESVRRLLSSTRLVTVAGAGGIGKTRLGMQVAADQAGTFPDGVWFVDLSAVSDPALVEDTIAESLGLRSDTLSRGDEPSASPLQRLLQHLRGSAALLVLDNCEHVVDACALAVDALLRACPRLCVLATSRQTLGVDGEVRWALPPLSIVEGEQSEAVRLFVERARLARPDFAPDGTVAEICRLVDGVPLGVELAAGWVHMLATDQIAARLNDRLALLDRGARGTVPRHRTLDATIDWSYRLLDEKERRLFENLSVFVDGFTIEAAEEVCADGYVERGDVLRVLSALTDKSLVVTVAKGRYGMLDSIRRFAWDRLVADEEVAGHGESESALVFSRDGEFWTIGSASQVSRLKDSKGLRYIHVLLGDPGREFHALDLVGSPRMDDTGDEMLDAQARDAYRSRLEELESDLEDAREFDDLARASKIEEEIDAIASELAHSVGLRGRPRRAGSPSERARLSTTKAIRDAIDRIGRELPRVSRHLQRAVRTGTFCSYAPDPDAPVQWSL